MAHAQISKAHTANTGTANTFSYSGSFNTFKASEVVVLLDDTALTFTSSSINDSASPREYTVDTAAKTVHIGGADLSSGTIIIKPVTDIGSPTARATYTAGSSIKSDDLNQNQTQLLRKSMEIMEQKLDTTGGTLTGDLTLSTAKTLIFEGATADAHETTLTVTDPTADRTITIPNVTGTVVTTGDTATVTATMMAADSVDSSELVDGSIDTSHIADSQVTAAKLASSSVTTAKINGDAVTGAKIADDSIDSEHYVDGSIDTAHIADLQVTTAKIAADAITGAKIADDQIDSEHLAAGSIDNEHIADGAIDSAALSAATVITASEQSGATANDTSFFTSSAADARYFNISSGDTIKDGDSFPDNDTSIATTAAINDRIIDLVDDVGGFVPLASEAKFPAANPDVNNGAGTIVSIGVLDSSYTPSSGTCTIPDSTLDNISGSDVTITDCGTTVLAAGFGCLVETTTTLHQYKFHRLTPKATEVTTVAGSIANVNTVATNIATVNDFADKYRIASSAPGSDNDDGDLYYNTTDNKLYIYDGSSWNVATALDGSGGVITGDTRYNDSVKAKFGTGSDLQIWHNATDSYISNSTGDLYILGSGDDTIIKAADNIQLKPQGDEQGINIIGDGAVELYHDNSKKFETTSAGATVTGTLTADLADNSIDSEHYVDGSIDTAHIADLNVTTAKIAADAITGAKIADDALDSEHYTDGSIDTAHLANDAVTGAKIADDAINSEHYTDGSIDTAHIADLNVTTAKIAADAITGAKIADDALDSEHYTDGSIDAAHIASNAVTTAKINADAVTGAKIADDAIDSEHYTDGSIDTAHIGDDQVTYAKIQNVSATDRVLGRDSSGAGVIEEITPANLRTMINVEDGADVTDATNVNSAGAVMNSDLDGKGEILIGDGSGDPTALAVGTNNYVLTADSSEATGVKWAAASSASVSDNSIDSEHYVDGSIDAEHIASNAVTTAKINADAVTGAKIADDAIDSEHYTDGSIDAAHIASNAVTTAKINADAVTGAKIADDAIDSEHYVDGSIDTAHIADNAVTLAKMASGTDGTIITFDASGNPTAVGPGTDGQVLTSTGAGSPPAFEDAAGGGKILQVVQGSTTTEQNSTSTTMADTGLSASITPATNSDVLVIVNQVMRQYRNRNSTNNQGLGVNVLRGSTVVMESKKNDGNLYNDFHTAGDGANNEVWRHTISFVDTNPGGDGSTAITYKTQFALMFTDDSGEAWAQPSWESQNQSPTSYIMLMEIDGGVT